MNEVKVAELCKKTREFELEGREVIGKYTLMKTAQIYNGIGSDEMPEWLRDIISYLHPALEPAALIHDIEWYESDRTHESFTESNQRFERNGCRIADLSYKWFNPMRYYVRYHAKRFAWACQKFGWSAWISG